jgi:kinesin family member C1
MAFSQSTSGRPPIRSRPQTSMAMKRPASSMDDEFESGGGPADGKRKGMIPYSPFSSISSSPKFVTLQYEKVRNRSRHNLHTVQENITPRDVSVRAALSQLSLEEPFPAKTQACSHIPKLALRSPRTSAASTCAAMRKSKVDDGNNAMVLFHNAEWSLVTPKTPSQIPVFSRAEASYATPATPSKAFRSSVTKTPFLTKDSNITAFTAWDVHGRLEDMEAMYSELKETLTGTSLERNGLEEAVAHFKARCMSITNLQLST